MDRESNRRGVEPALARQVAQQLMAKDAVTAHARDELGISETTAARPVQAAFTSAATFGFLALLGAVGANAGGAKIMRATTRVTFWGALAMTATVGKLVGAVV